MSYMTLILVLVVIPWGLLVMYNLFLSPHRHLPGPIISQLLPVYDYYFLVRGEFHDYITKLHKVYGPVVRLGNDRVALNHPEAWKEIHSTYKYPKSSFYDHMRTVGRSMITINDRASHSSRRRAVAKAFGETNIANLESIVMDIGVNKLLQKIEEKLHKSDTHRITLDFSKEFIYQTFDVIGRLVFGKELNIINLERHPILDWTQKLVIWIVLNAALPPFRLIGNPYFKRVALLALESINSRRMERRKDHHGKKKSTTDILDELMNATDPETNQGISDLDLMEECAELLVAGADTTGLTLTWVLYNIMIVPGVKARLVQEVRGLKSRTITMSQCQRDLTYLQSVIKEGMRLYPVAAHPMFRVVPEPGADLLGWHLPAKTEVFTSTYAIHRSSDYWSNPDDFIPDRWLTTSGLPSEGEVVPYTFIPYSTGPRACPGRHLANMEVTLTLANLINRFDLTLSDKQTTLVPASYIALQPKGHAPLLISVTGSS